MNRNKLPLDIDPIALAIKGADLAGTYELKHFPRLKPVLKNEDLKAEFTLRFQKDETGLLTITGTILVGIDLTCERCNEIVHLDLELHPRLAPIVSESKAQDLPEDYDPIITNGEFVRLSELVEDEILLSIPMIPKHEWGGCPVDLSKTLLH
jgi:uncharacterized protein